MIHLTSEEIVYETMLTTLAALRQNQPKDRSEIDRAYAVAITEMQKVIGFWMVWAVYARNAPVRPLLAILDETMDTNRFSESAHD